MANEKYLEVTAWIEMKNQCVRMRREVYRKKYDEGTWVPKDIILYPAEPHTVDEEAQPGNFEKSY